MSDNVNESEKVGSWWAASSDAEHESVSLYEKVGGRESLLDSITVTREDFASVEDFKLFVKQNFGGGIYVAVVRGPHGTFGKRHEFAISGRPIRERVDDPAVQQPPQQQSEIALLLERMDENQRRSDDRFTQILERVSSKPERDTLADFQAFAGIMRDTGTVQQPQKSIIEQLQEFKAGAELLGMGERDDDKESLLPILAELVGGIKEFATESEITKRYEAAARSRGPGQPVRPELPAVPPAAAPSVEIESGLMSLLSQLVQAAEKGADVKDIAGQILEKAKANPKHGENLKSLLLREDALQMLQKFNPKVGQFFDWFEELANEILVGMGEVDGADSAGGEPESGKPADTTAKPEAKPAARRRGNAANAAANAGARAPRKTAAGSKSASASAGK